MRTVRRLVAVNRVEFALPVVTKYADNTVPMLIGQAPGELFDAQPLCTGLLVVCAGN